MPRPSKLSHLVCRPTAATRCATGTAPFSGPRYCTRTSSSALSARRRASPGRLYRPRSAGRESPGRGQDGGAGGEVGPAPHGLHLWRARRSDRQLSAVEGTRHQAASLRQSRHDDVDVLPRPGPQPSRIAGRQFRHRRRRAGLYAAALGPPTRTRSASISTPRKWSSASAPVCAPRNSSTSTPEPPRGARRTCPRDGPGPHEAHSRVSEKTEIGFPAFAAASPASFQPESARSIIASVIRHSRRKREIQGLLCHPLPR